MAQLRSILAGSGLVATGFVAALALAQVMPRSPAGHADGGMDHGAMPGQAAQGTQAGMAGMTHADDHATTGRAEAAPMDAAMPGMDHSGMTGTQPGGNMAGMDHSSMGSMDHANMTGMTASPSTGGRTQSRAGQGAQGSSMPGMDHSSMAGMDHASMTGMTSTPSTGGRTQARAGQNTQGSSTAGMDHSSMAGMDLANMPGMVASGTSSSAGSTVQWSARAIALNFDRAMTVQSVVLTNSAGQRIPTTATLPDAPTVSVQLPVRRLQPGSYQVAWTATDGDQPMNGGLAFTVR